MKCKEQTEESKYNTREKGVCVTKKKKKKKELCANIQDYAKELTPKDLYEGDKEYNVGNTWNDVIGYVKLQKGCYLAAYVDVGYKGSWNNLVREEDRHIHKAEGSNGKDDEISEENGYVGYGWRNTISSYKCGCVDYEGKEFEFEEPDIE